MVVYFIISLTMFNFIFNRKSMIQGGEIQKTLNEVLEVVRFMKDTFATREELHEVRDELNEKIDFVYSYLNNKIDFSQNDVKESIESVNNKTINHIDGFIKLHNNHEAEISALRMKVYRLEEGSSYT